LNEKRTSYKNEKTKHPPDQKKFVVNFKDYGERSGKKKTERKRLKGGGNPRNSAD